jgi:hypothetical protein
MMALAPWRSPEHRQAYQRSIDHWHIATPPEPLAFSLYIDQFFTEDLNPADQENIKMSNANF